MGGAAAGRAEQGGVAVSHKLSGGRWCPMRSTPSVGRLGMGCLAPGGAGADHAAVGGRSRQAPRREVSQMLHCQPSTHQPPGCRRASTAAHTSRRLFYSAGLPPSVGRQQQPRYARQARSRDRTRRLTAPPTPPVGCLACVPLGVRSGGRPRPIGRPFPLCTESRSLLEVARQVVCDLDSSATHCGEARPLANEALVRDVDHGVVVQLVTPADGNRKDSVSPARNTLITGSISSRVAPTIRPRACGIVGGAVLAHGCRGPFSVRLLECTLGDLSVRATRRRKSKASSAVPRERPFNAADRPSRSRRSICLAAAGRCSCQ